MAARDGGGAVSRLVVVGDALLDRDLHGEIERFCPEAPAPVVEGLRISSRPGGAALAAALAAGEGHEVTFVTALGEGSAGQSDSAERRGRHEGRYRSHCFLPFDGCWLAAKRPAPAGL